MKTPTAQPETYQEAQTSFTQMIAKAESEIARLSAQETQIALQLQTNEAEMESLALQAASHETTRQTAQSTIDQRRKTLREASAQAELAEGTMASKPDLKRLEGLLKQAQTEQLVIIDRVAKAEQAEERRRNILENACEQYQRDLIQLSERKDAMEATKNRVFAEQGEAEYTQQLNTLASLQETLTIKEQEVQQAKEAIDEMGRKALLSLSQWPDLQDQCSTVLPYHDTTTMLLEAAMGLLDILLTSGHDVEHFDVQMLREAGMNFGSIENTLSWDESACLDALYAARQSEPITLRQKRIDLTRLLEVYKTHKKEAVK